MVILIAEPNSLLNGLFESAVSACLGLCLACTTRGAVPELPRDDAALPAKGAPRSQLIEMDSVCA